MDMLLMASLIWLGEQVAPVDSYYRFRKSFQLKDTKGAMLRIAADSDYTVFINGKRVHVLQFPDFPDRKTFATVDVTDFVKKGDNVIAVLVHHMGQSFCGNACRRDGCDMEMQHGSGLYAEPEGHRQPAAWFHI